MPRQRIHHSRITYDFTQDFPERLERFKEESGLSWSEIARRIGTYRHTVGRWVEQSVTSQVPKESTETQAQLCTNESRQRPRLEASLYMEYFACDQ